MKTILSFVLAGATLAALAGCQPDDGEAPDGGAISACGDVPVSGRCADASTVETCVLPTDGAHTFVARRTCAMTETCRSDGGTAACVPVGACAEGTSSCVDPMTVRTCTGGQWAPTACATACMGNALGAACLPDIPLHPITGRLANEVRKANATGDGLLPVTTEASAGMLILSYHDGVVIDAQVTSSDPNTAGTFTVNIADQPSADDFIGAVPVALDADRVLFGVSDHGIPQDVIDATKLDALIGQAPPTAKLWGWKFPVSTLGASPSLTIKEDEGAGAAHIFHDIRAVFVTASQIYPMDRPRSLIAWFSRGITYDAVGAPASFYNVPNDPQGVMFDSQFVIGDNASGDVWNDDIIIHELGHYWMWSHSTLPGEGGPHNIFQKSLPGLAWAEGFANWLSLVNKGSPLFDLNITAPGMLDFSAGTGTALQDGQLVQLALDPTSPDKPLIQGMSEAQVTQILWRLSTGPGGAVPLLQALAAPRLTQGPFERGYTRYTPKYGPNGDVTGYEDTGVSVPMLADFLDALECSGFDHAAVDAAIANQWPYPSASPICR